MAALYQRSSDGRWIARVHTPDGFRYITGVDRDEVVRRTHERYRETVPVRKPTDDEERFWAKVLKGTNCWLWTGALVGEARNYGHFWDGTKRVRAHRFAYEMENGPIPEGLEIDHLCHNAWCVRPSHLEAVPPKVNQDRRLRKGRFRKPIAA